MFGSLQNEFGEKVRSAARAASVKAEGKCWCLAGEMGCKSPAEWI